VIKNSLRVYEAIIAKTEKGGEIMLKESDGRIVPYHIFF
jgi:hypothetical protein